jgi:hypothetical protein
MTDEQKLVLSKIETFYKSNKDLKDGNLEGAVNALIGWASELTTISTQLEELKKKLENYITKEECEKQIQTLQNNFNEDKSKWEVKKEEDITKAVETAIMESDKEWQEKTKDYDEIKESSEYKFAQFLFKLLHLTKKESE